MIFSVGLTAPTDGTNLVYSVQRDAVETTEDAVFPVEKSGGNCHFLFVAAADDGMTPSVKSFDILTKRLQKAGLGHLCDMLVYVDHGHVTEPPYFPHSDGVFHKYAGKELLF